MRTPEFIERCLASGMPLEMALKAARAFEAECETAIEEILDSRRAKERARQAKHRAKKIDGNNVTSRDITLDDATGVEERDLTGEPAQVVIPSSSLRSEEVVVGGVGSAGATSDDWPPGKADHHAKLLVETVASPWLDQNKSPDLVTTRGRVAAWKRDGASWEHDVLPVVIGLCANRRSRISSWKFFDAAVSRSIAENRAALDIPIIGPRQAHERPHHDAKFAARQANLATHERGADLAARFYRETG